MAFCSSRQRLLSGTHHITQLYSVFLSISRLCQLAIQLALPYRQDFGDCFQLRALLSVLGEVRPYCSLSVSSQLWMLVSNSDMSLRQPMGREAEPGQQPVCVLTLTGPLLRCHDEVTVYFKLYDQGSMKHRTAQYVIKETCTSSK